MRFASTINKFNLRKEIHLKLRYSLIITFFFLMLGCGDAKRSIALEDLKNDEDIIVHIDTDLGNMIVILYDKTPLHKNNFINLANEDFYNGLLFHRVIKGFMIQGGDPLSRNASSDDVLGRGDIGQPIKAEIDSSLFHKKGVLSAARKVDQVNPNKESNGSQFFIVHGTKFSKDEMTNTLIDYRKLYSYFDSAMKSEDFEEIKSSFVNLQTEGDREDIRNFIVNAKDTIEQFYNVEIDKFMPQKHKEVYESLGGYPSLDGAYTAFGEVVEGIEVIDKIASVNTGKADRPLEDIKMNVYLEKLSKREIEKRFNYKY